MPAQMQYFRYVLRKGMRIDFMYFFVIYLLRNKRTSDLLEG